MPSAAKAARTRTTRANQVSIGTTTQTYTLAGVNSGASKAAQSGDTYFLTGDASGNLATTSFSVSALDSRIASLEGSVGEIDGRIDKAFEGSAMAMAMAGAALPADKDFAVSINWGGFEGANARNAPFNRTPFKRTPFKRTPLKRTPFKRTPLRRIPLRRMPLRRIPFKRIPLP